VLRRLAAEGLGSLLLAATVAVLATLVALLAPVSGAHFNPAVSLVQALRGALRWRDAATYAAIQLVGCCAGAMVAHAMFSLPLIQSSVHERTGIAQWLAEYVATLGLLLVILGHRKAQDAPWMIAAWIGAAYWFTSSTSFANPAITIARSLSNTFVGISPSHVPAFVLAQVLGALTAIPVAKLLFAETKGENVPDPS
jgi:glycerol uptake facilitator-like aquaporin